MFMPNIVISGATKGIGLSLVNKFAAEGFNLAVCARHSIDLENLKKRVESEYPNSRVYTFTCDASKKEDIIAFGKFSIQSLGSIDVLINNVGIFLPGTIQSEADGIFEQQLNINIAAAYHLTRTVLPIFIAHKNGYIFNLCSTASIMAYSNGGSYCISKFAMLGFSKVLREELKHHHVRVSAVLPGATNTASWEGSGISDERFINPDDIADMIYNFYQTPKTMNIEEILVRPMLGDIL
jgi:short-subunit dehydrogenase